MIAPSGEGTATPVLAAARLWRSQNASHWIRFGGSSMSPSICNDDEVLVEFGGPPPALSEVALFERAGQVVFHRVHAGGHDGPFLTAGDACRFPDLPVSLEAILGRSRVRRRAGVEEAIPRPTEVSGFVAVFSVLFNSAPRLTEAMLKGTRNFAHRWGRLP